MISPRLLSLIQDFGKDIVIDIASGGDETDTFSGERGFFLQGSG